MTRASSRGFALPVVLLAVFGAGIAWAVYATRLAGSFNQHAKIQTETTLRLARDALIQYAAHAGSSPGALPCPDLANNGEAALSCGGNTPLIGRLPWKTLGIDPPRDGSGECLWYALSSGARNALHVDWRGVTQPALNPAWGGSFVLYDAARRTRTNIIAVLIAPGARLANQARTPGERCNNGGAANFLEALGDVNNASGTQAVRAPTQVGFNDSVLAVSARDVYDAVAPRVLLELAGSNDTNGLRALLRSAPTPDDPAQPSWAWYLDTDGHPVINFLDRRVIDAFPAAKAPAQPRAKNACTQYAPAGESGDTVAIEWLCFNSWTQFIQFNPQNPARIVLTLPSLGWQAVWQANTAPVTKTRLQRVHGI